MTQTDHNNISQAASERPTYCVECGSEISYAYRSDYPERLAFFSLCFSCDFWVSILNNEEEDGSQSKRERTRFVAPHDSLYPLCRSHYEMGLDPPTNFDARMTGHGGRRFEVSLIDRNTTYVSRNVWCQGAIPCHFYDRFPVTATMERMDA